MEQVNQCFFCLMNVDNNHFEEVSQTKVVARPCHPILDLLPLMPLPVHHAVSDQYPDKCLQALNPI